jgi:hypothetical protein
MTKATTEQVRVGRATAWMAVVAIVAALLLAGLVAPPTYATPSTFTVNRTGDQPDTDTNNPNCDVAPSTTGNQCTLRAAIQQANANANPAEVDKINFHISGTGVHTISPGSALPFTSEPVAINGYSQPGTSANTLTMGTNAKLLIQIDGTNSGAGGVSGGININASNSVVKGLIINRFTSTSGIEIDPMGDASVPDETVTNVRVEGNFIGTDPSGTLDKGNRFLGVSLFAASNNTIGGTSLASRNLISGNDAGGSSSRARATTSAQVARTTTR